MNHYEESTMSLDKFKRNREKDLIGKRIRLISMDDIEPIEPDSMGTITHIGGGVINVNWDNGRGIGVVEGYDQYQIIDE